MAINFVTRDASDDSIRFQPMERLKVYLFGAIVLFASFGMGEAVYRLLFSEFDDITDRIPVEMVFGLVFGSPLCSLVMLTGIGSRGAQGLTSFSHEDGFDGLSKFINWIRDNYPRARMHLKRVFADGDFVNAPIHG